MTIARYSVLRIMLLLGCLLLVYLVFRMFGVTQPNPVLLLAVAGALSLVLSLFLLRGPRAALAAQVAARVDRRLPVEPDDDEAVEDAADEARRPHDG